MAATKPDPAGRLGGGDSYGSHTVPIVVRSLRSRSGATGLALALLVSTGPLVAVEPDPGQDVAAAPAAADVVDDRTGRALTVFDEVAAMVRDDFFDPAWNGVDWPDVVARHRVRVRDDPSRVHDVLRGMLALLEVSHTALFTEDQPAYYQLLGIFEEFLRTQAPDLLRERFGDAGVTYPGIGVATVASSGGGFVVTGVYEGFPAAEAGVRLGDVILAVDGQPFEPVASFVGRVGVPVSLEILRTPGAASSVVQVVPATIDATTIFVEAMRASATVHQVAGTAVGYVHAWSYAGEQYHELLEALVLGDGPLATAEALVLDLRGGWGGADPAYLRLFAERVPVLEIVGRDGTRRRWDRQWRKPVVLLVDGDTRSGKEGLAAGFQRYDLGPVVGTRTAGAVLAGSPRLLSDGSVLYLAVADVRVDGERLEGVGVAPDIEVPFEVRDAGGRDPQRAVALEVAAKLVSPEGR